MAFDKCTTCFCPYSIKWKGLAAVRVPTLYLSLLLPSLDCTGFFMVFDFSLLHLVPLGLHPLFPIITEKIFHYTDVLQSVYLFSWEENHILNMKSRVFLEVIELARHGRTYLQLKLLKKLRQEDTLDLKIQSQPE